MQGHNALDGQYGTVYYTHAGGVDRPIDVVRNDTLFVPHVNWRGHFSVVTDANGNDCSSTSCYNLSLPGDRRKTFLDAPNQSMGHWFGSVLADQQDVSGLLYRRNRYYDAASGQFTQEDPIGIAGGLNLYGYANGDPINFSDPFGLTPACAVGAGVGALAEIGTSLFGRRRPAFGRVLASAGAGCLTGGTSALARMGVGRLVQGLSVSLLSVVEGEVKAALDGGETSGGEVLTNAGVGIVSEGLGQLLKASSSDVFDWITKNSDNLGISHESRIEMLDYARRRLDNFEWRAAFLGALIGQAASGSEGR